MLIILTALAFYLVFPDGLLEDYVYPRPEPLIGYEIAAIAATAVLLTAIYAVVAREVRPWPGGAALGLLLGLLASAPAHLALFGVVRSAPWREFVPALWTAASWGVAGATISWFLTRRLPGSVRRQ